MINVNDESFDLACGCNCINVNGKYITILCDEHDNEYESQEKIPQKTKMRYNREI